MKKAIVVIILGLLWCGTVISAEKNITGFKKIKKSMPLKKVDRIKTVKHEIKLERSVKIILALFAVGVLLNAFTIGDIISSAEARHNTNNTAYGEGSMHVTIDNWPQ